MRKVLIALLVLGLVATGADVLARRLAERQVARRLQRTFDLGTQPRISMRGTPFLVKLARGNISKLLMTGKDVRSEDLTFDRLELEMSDVRFSLADVIEGTGGVTVARGEGLAFVTEGNVNDALSDAGAPFTVAISSSGVTASSEQTGFEARADVVLETSALSVAAEGVSSVPLDLPSLGERVVYESIALQDGQAMLRFIVEGFALKT